jgi:hypothetical protein
MADSTSGPVDLGFGQVSRWAWVQGLVSDAPGERRLAAMRLDVLAGGALPHGTEADVALTAQWAVFICWVDDHIDRGGQALSPGLLEAFTAPLRQVFAPRAHRPEQTAPYASVLAGLWERTAAGMPARWRERFAQEYTDFLDATEQEMALRRAGTRLSVVQYVRLRRRTITLLPMLNVLERTGDAVMVEDPRIDTQVRDLRWALADIAGWANDLASGADDALVGQANLVALIAYEEGCLGGQACTRARAMIEERHRDFHTMVRVLRDMPLQSGRREELCRYLDLVERFLSATLHWLSITGRFTAGAATAAVSYRPPPL